MKKIILIFIFTLLSTGFLNNVNANVDTTTANDISFDATNCTLNINRKVDGTHHRYNYSILGITQNIDKIVIKPNDLSDKKLNTIYKTIDVGDGCRSQGTSFTKEGFENGVLLKHYKKFYNSDLGNAWINGEYNDDNRYITKTITGQVSTGNNKVYYVNFDTKVYFDLPPDYLTEIDPKTNLLKIIGTLQGDEKSEQTGQQSNFSDLSKSDLRTQIRTQIRSAAYKYTKSMTNGQIVNGVKYVVGDITLNTSSDLGYETLVVKDGNVIISGDLTQFIQIIVLKDGYDVNSDYANKGNVYVKPNVKNINAVIYADGGFMSIDNSGNLLLTDDEYRASKLQEEQLISNGSLFTRNTTVDKTNPKTNLTSISDTKKAGINNISINETIYDDDGKTDTTSLYGGNYGVFYKLTIKGPKQAGYAGTVINENSVNINETGSIVNNQKLNKTFSLTLAGKYDVSIKLTDKAGLTYTENKTITIYPADLDVTQTTIAVDSNGDKYANNSDVYTYTLNLKDAYGNAIYGKSLIGVNQDCGAVTGCEYITTNMSNRTGDDAIIEQNYNTNTDSNGKTTFQVKSLSPGVFTQRFSIKINNWDDNYNTTSTSKTINKTLTGNNSFKKPFTAVLKVSDNGTDYNSYPKVGTTQKYKFELTKKSNLDYSSGSISSISTETITQGVSGHNWQDFGNIDYNFGSDYTDYLGFTARINATSNVLTSPEVKIGNMTISYYLGGKEITYKLNNSDTVSGYNSIDTNPDHQLNTNITSLQNTQSSTTLGLKVVGTLQGDEKSEQTGQQSNFSDLSKSDLRAQIRSAAYKYTKSMTNGQIVNGVKYVVGDITLNTSSDLGYETLVVKDGNVIISGDLTQSKLGIIVLKDGYDVNSDYANKGNVYVKPNVKNINAVIYADGGFMSIDNSGNLLLTDNEDRNSKLQEQLILNGSLFTRNTIGGAILGSINKYTLPGGSVTSDFNKAMIYDLNYVRRGNLNPQNGYTDNFVIKYDSSIQIDPPKLFK